MKKNLEILDDSQMEIIHSIDAGFNVFITGAGGVGKTVVAKAIKESLGDDLVVTASTGIAALNCEGVTIHSFTGLVNFNEPADTMVARIKAKSAVVDRIQSCQHLLIDEISMLDGRYLDALDVLFKSIKGVGTPMGGVQLIFIGDFLQLPPVCKYGSPTFAFQSKLWESARFKEFNLTKIFRQSDASTIRALRHIRVGKVTDKVVDFYRRRVNAVDSNPEVEPVVLHSRNVDVDTFNEKRLLGLKDKIHTFHAEVTGEAPYRGNLIKNCMAPEQLKLAVGAQVMLLKNLSTEDGLVNGAVGVVKSIDKYGFPKVKFNCGITKLIDKTSTWRVKIKGVVVASFTQLPLKLAWSTTIHKSQGLTLDKVRIALKGCFADGQAYVALSRARSIEGVFLDDFQPSFVKTSKQAYAFYRAIYERSNSMP